MEGKEPIWKGDMLDCPNCMTYNPSITEFCKSCGYPLGQYVTVDPINRILSMGWLYRKAVSGRVTVFGFWGMWILFGGAILCMLIFLILSAGVDTDRGIYSGLWPYVIPLMGYIVILYRVTKNYLQIKRKTAVVEVNAAENTGDEWVCTKCNATVEENATICPNCGDDVREIEED